MPLQLPSCDESPFFGVWNWNDCRSTERLWRIAAGIDVCDTGVSSSAMPGSFINFAWIPSRPAALPFLNVYQIN